MTTSEFFEWLQPRLPSIARNKQVQRALSEKLEQLHPGLRWEIGPGIEKESFLAISPNLKPEALQVTRQIANQAPAIPNWEILPAKPRKRWKTRSLRIRGIDSAREYNFESWRYYLTSFNDDEFFDVHVVPIGYEEEEKSQLQYVADLIVEFELGEELFMDKIDKVHVAYSRNLERETDTIGDLYDHILSLAH
jgi:hypothetical protein